jgi:predicted transcriptional regulator
MGKIDIAAIILELALEGTSAKSIQDKTGLPRSVLDEHLKMLVSRGLIGVSTTKNVKITKRGSKFLDMYNSIRTRYLKIPA